MKNNELSEFKSKLLKEKRRLLNTIDSIDENIHDSSFKNYSSELSVYDNHPADIGTETFMLAQDINLKNNEEEILSKVEAALTKIENGSYGKCEVCNNEIKSERLEIIPYVKTCKNCMDHENVTDEMNNYRPSEEDSLGFPFGKNYKDFSEEEYVGTDGEDIIQKVDEYNKINTDPSEKTGDEIGIYDNIEHGTVEEVEKITNSYYRRQLE